MAENGQNRQKMKKIRKFMKKWIPKVHFFTKPWQKNGIRLTWLYRQLTNIQDPQNPQKWPFFALKQPFYKKNEKCGKLIEIKYHALILALFLVEIEIHLEKKIILKFFEEKNEKQAQNRYFWENCENP